MALMQGPEYGDMNERHGLPAQPQASSPIIILDTSTDDTQSEVIISSDLEDSLRPTYPPEAAGTSIKFVLQLLSLTEFVVAHM